MKETKTFNEYMNEEKAINRWRVLTFGIYGFFAGVIATLFVSIYALF